MEKASPSKFTHFLEKLEASSEPGLTNAQLMLTNDDLKPGMLPFEEERKSTCADRYHSRT